MQFKEAYTTDSYIPNESTRRLVFAMPGDNLLVVKFFGNQTIGSVKIWSSSLDYNRTVRSWKTNKRYQPTAAEINGARQYALSMLESSGFRAHAIVNQATE